MACVAIPQVSLDELKSIASIAVPAVYLAARLIVVSTRTPPPGTWWGKVYRLIEIVALEVGHAKDTGVLPRSKADAALAEAIELAKRTQANAQG